MQSCAQQRLLGQYSGSEAECPLCSTFNASPGMVQLAGDIAFTVGVHLQAQALGGARYRYLFDVEDGGGVMGATHTSDVAYFSAEPAAAKNGKASLDIVGAGLRVEEKTHLGRSLRQYWTSFAHTGVPTSSSGPAWMPVEHGRSVPMLQMRLDDSTMRTKEWYSDATTDLLGHMACGRVRLATRLGRCGWMI